MKPAQLLRCKREEVIMREKRLVRTGLAAAVGLLIGAVVFAYAASNTVPSSRAGDGSGAVSGYTVSNVAYHLDSASPQQVASVEFDLNAPASEVRVLLQTGGSWFTCTNPSSNHWTCATTGQSVAGVDQLRVVAVE